MDVLTLNAKRAVAIRHYGKSDPRVTGLESEIRTGKIAAVIRRELASGPITASQKDHLHALLESADMIQAPQP